MRRLYFTLLTISGLVLLAACSADNDSEPTPPKATYTIDFEDDAFQSKVATESSSWDFVQEGYAWQDEQTSLCHTVIFGDWYAGGGLILSRYNTSDPAAKGTYESDLYVYNANNEDSTTGGGYDGSNTFLIANGNYEPDIDAELDLRPEMTFADGKPRTIRECWVNSTSYFVNIAENGNAFSPAMKEGEEIRLYATGYDAQGREGRTVEFSFARKGALIKEWSRWDLASLGEVVSIKFNIRGGNTDEWGMTTPKYFAIDHIVVEER